MPIGVTGFISFLRHYLSRPKKAAGRKERFHACAWDKQGFELASNYLWREKLHLHHEGNKR
jgi:hypothetical protein